MGARHSRDEDISGIVSRELRVMQLEQEVRALKVDNNELRRQLMSKLRDRSGGTDGAPDGQVSAPSVVSPEIAYEIVEQMLADPMSNLGFVPDFMERPLERQTLLYLLKGVARTVDSARIEILGHELLMRMQPIVRGAPEDNIANAVSGPPEEGYSDYDDRDISSEVLMASAFDARKVLM